MLNQCYILFIKKEQYVKSMLYIVYIKKEQYVKSMLYISFNIP